jgi:hypothetical protein
LHSCCRFARPFLKQPEAVVEQEAEVPALLQVAA